MRLRRKGLKFIDITDHTDFYEEHAAQAASADKPRMSTASPHFRSGY
jgi:hypothetical protein